MQIDPMMPAGRPGGAFGKPVKTVGVQSQGQGGALPPDGAGNRSQGEAMAAGIPSHRARTMIAEGAAQVSGSGGDEGVKTYRNFGQLVSAIAREVLLTAQDASAADADDSAVSAGGPAPEPDALPSPSDASTPSPTSAPEELTSGAPIDGRTSTSEPIADDGADEWPAAGAPVLGSQPASVETSLLDALMPADDAA